MQTAESTRSRPQNIESDRSFSFPASIPEARYITHERNTAGKEVGEDLANEGGERSERSHARAEDNPADVEQGPLIDQAAINLKRRRQQDQQRSWS